MVLKVRRPAKKSRAFLPMRRRICQFCADKTRTIDYKDLKTIESFVRERGRIISTRGSGNCGKHQRQVARAIRKARFLALLAYVRI